MADEIQDTSELVAPDATTLTDLITPVPLDPPIAFSIFETIVHGNQVFHPGQERELLAADLPAETIVILLKIGSIRGRYPKFESVSKMLGATAHNTGN